MLSGPFAGTAVPGTASPGVSGDADGATPAHHAPDGTFRNTDPAFRTKDLGEVLRWRYAATRDGLPKAGAPAPRVEPDLAFLRANAAAGARMQPAVTWIGHATVLVQAGGVNVLTDPVFSERASPVSWAGPKRVRAPGIALANLPFPVSPDASVAAAKAAIAAAADAGAGLVCFPECFVPGYRALGAPLPPPDADWLEEAHTQVAEAARVAGITVALGTERFVNGALRITVLVVGADGSRLGWQDKVQLDPSEEHLYQPGAGRDDERLAERMRVPGAACAGLKGHRPTTDPRRCAPLETSLDAHCAREILGGANARSLGAGPLDGDALAGLGQNRGRGEQHGDHC